MVEATPLGRVEASRSPGLYAFRSDEASFITGEVLLVDGGLGM